MTSLTRTLKSMVESPESRDEAESVEASLEAILKDTTDRFQAQYIRLAIAYLKRRWM